jgi:hypothetical protein
LVIRVADLDDREALLQGKPDVFSDAAHEDSLMSWSASKRSSRRAGGADRGRRRLIAPEGVVSGPRLQIDT